METAPKLGDQRYLACWCDAEALAEEAVKNGWDREGDVGALDYAESGNHEVYVNAADFEDAKRIAYSKFGRDYFGNPRVYLQEFGPADVPARAREWESIKFWDIEADGSAVSGN